MSQIYKELVSFFFKIVYGKINYFHKKNRCLKMYKVEKNKIKYKIFEIENCRVYTDTVHDTAFINNNKIINQVSFQLRNLVNSNIKNNRVLKHGTPKFLKTLDSPLLCILSGGAGNNNYWHWMYDVLPRIGIAESKFALKKFKFVFVPNKEFLYQIDTLKILGILKNSVSSKKFKHIYSNKIIATNHPWQYSKSAHKDICVVPKWISFWIRKKFLKFKSKKKFYNKIYIDRSDSKFNVNNKRIILNEKEIREILLKKKFKIIKLSKYNFKDQIAIFNNAKIIVGNHGAGFANLAFCKKNTKIIEFIDKNTSKPIKKISKDLNLNYFSVQGKRINSDTGDQNNNLQVPTKKLISLLK